jgi:branched-chain amino acid transport system permease protein
MQQLLQFVLSGVLLGGTYALASVGLALIFGVMRVVNFSQADFMMLAMYAAFVLWVALHLDPLVSLLLVAPLFFGVGWLYHRVLLSRITGRREAHDAQVILTLGTGIVLQAAALIAFGADPRVVHSSLTGASHLGPLFLDRARAIAFVIALVGSAGLYLFLRYTTPGKVLRAAADDWEAAEYAGIDVQAAHRLAFGLGLGLTALAGVLITTFRPFGPFIGLQFIVIMFVAVVLGGLGSIMGALVGGLVVGVVEVVAQLFLPPVLSPAVVFVLFLLLLYLRPQGLFGQRQRRI